ncbi:MAG: hypothetical protein K9W42_01665 [Candidatus Heimdallarchaeota archaeon]|nr:hypothetical protein [Candidatus Heimdallarchaeota archaeon]
MKKKAIILFFCGLFLLPIVTAQAATPPVRLTTNSTVSRLQLKLYNATYGDLDTDGKADDIICYLDVEIISDLHRKTFMIEITVILPNGDNYAYSILVSTVNNKATIILQFMNHAYVAGDYCIKAEVNLYTEGIYYNSTEIYFDPPSEEVPDDDPYISYMAI